MANICSVPCHIWSHMSHVVTLVTFPMEVIIPGNSLCLGSYSYEKILFPGRISQEVAFPGSPISKEVTFPEKSHFLGSQISREIIFPGKVIFSGSHIFREVIFPGKVTLGCKISWDVKFL